MNLLLINHYAGSTRHGMEFRPYYLAREWVRAGHRVQIVAASYSHVRSRQPSIGWRVKRERIDGIEYRWMPAPRYEGNGLGRALNIAAFLAGLWRDAARLAARFRPDAVIASSTYPLDVWVARHIARRAGAKLVYEVHDLWPLSPIELGGMSPSHPFIRLCQRAEDDAYRDADRVVSMLPNVAEHMAAHGLDLAKLHVVPNGVTLDEWRRDPPPLDNAALADHLKKLRAAGRIVVGYAGSHGVPNALDVLLDTAIELRHEPVSFVLVGEGMERARLLERVHAESIANVAMFPPVPKAQIPRLLREFDIAYIGWKRLPIYRFGIAPNKLMDYMMAERPVVHSVEAGNDPVAQSGCGLTVQPESPAAAAAGIRTLAMCSPEQRAALGARGRAFVMAHHTYPVLARRFLEILGEPAAAVPAATPPLAAASEPGDD